MNVHLCPKSLIIKKKWRKKKMLCPNLWPFKIGLIWSIWLYFIPAVQKRPQNIRKARQFYMCIINSVMTIQSRVIFVIVLQICFYACYVISVNCFYNSNICLVKNVKDTCYYTNLTGFRFIFSRFEDTDFFVKQVLLWKIKNWTLRAR